MAKIEIWLVHTEAPLATRSAFALAPPRPNPAINHLTLGFDLSIPATVSLAVYDRLGRRVAVLTDEAVRAAGRHEVGFDGSALASDVYVVRALMQPLDGRAAETATQRLVVAR